MSVLKVKKNGEWENIIDSTKDADTLDGKHASEFASIEDTTNLKNLIGNTSVSAQISNAINSLSSGKTLSQHLSEENMILTSLQYGDTLPTSGIPGRIFFKKVNT